MSINHRTLSWQQREGGRGRGENVKSDDGNGAVSTREIRKALTMRGHERGRGGGRGEKEKNQSTMMRRRRKDKRTNMILMTTKNERKERRRRVKKKMRMMKM